MNTTKIGDKFELQVYHLLATEIEKGRFVAPKENCKIYHKKAYYSLQRKSEIVFDIAIEVYMPGRENYSFVYLVECKKYGHSVPVDDIEEFYGKCQQVASAKSKSILFTNAKFQSGAFEFAESVGMGLVRYFPDVVYKWVLDRSPSVSVKSYLSPHQIQITMQSDSKTDQSIFDYYFYGLGFTNSLWHFFAWLASDFRDFSVISLDESDFISVPYITKGKLEEISRKAVDSIRYSGGKVDLFMIYAAERRRHDLKLIYRMNRPKEEENLKLLGRITFPTNTIEIFPHNGMSRFRERFTLAHELAHHLLGHGRYMKIETFEEDESGNLPIIGSAPDIERMEFQANYLAGCLLMPEKELKHAFYQSLALYKIENRGHGELFVDW